MSNGYANEFREQFLDVLSEHVAAALPGNEHSVCTEINEQCAVALEDNQTWMMDPPSGIHLMLSCLILAGDRVLDGRQVDPEARTGILRASFLDASHRLASAEQLFASMLATSADAFRTFVDYSKQLEEQRYGKTFTFEHERDDNNAFHFAIRKCFYHDFFTAHDKPGLTTVLCAGDSTWMEALQKADYGFTCERTTTLPDGSDACRYRLDRTH